MWSSMRSATSRVLALFDLDGTLLPWDTQLLFYRDVVRQHRWRMLLLVPFFCCVPLAYFLGDGRMKRLFLAYLWKMKRSEIEKLASQFVQKTVMPLLYEEVVGRLRKHQRNGDFCVLTTASPDIYASIIAGKLGFDRFFATDVFYGDRMGFYPSFPEGNNKGQVKVDRLVAHGLMVADSVNEDIAAYSDSSADLPMLLAASRQVLVNPSKSLSSLLVEGNCEIVRPPVPWASRSGKMREICRQLLGIRKE